ncbi:MAG: lipoate-protein ligase A [Limisphaerales bacterium]
MSFRAGLTGRESERITMGETWHFLNSGKGDPAWNMAVDEALLAAAGDHGISVLRFYGWTESAATFGYFQRYSEIESLTDLRPLIRRPTGGGLAPHDSDWTYSVAIPPSHAWFSLKAVESYRRVHEWLRRAFASIRVETTLAPCCQKEGPGQCFIGAEQFDLLLGDRKLAGAAQRRTKAGLLIQGSIQLAGLDVDRRDWESAMLESASRNWGVDWKEIPDLGSLQAEFDRLATEKYRSDDFNRRR